MALETLWDAALGPEVKREATWTRVGVGHARSSCLGVGGAGNVLQALQVGGSSFAPKEVLSVRHTVSAQ